MPVLHLSAPLQAAGGTGRRGIFGGGWNETFNSTGDEDLTMALLAKAGVTVTRLQVSDKVFDRADWGTTPDAVDKIKNRG